MLLPLLLGFIVVLTLRVTTVVILSNDYIFRGSALDERCVIKFDFVLACGHKILFCCNTVVQYSDKLD